MTKTLLNACGEPPSAECVLQVAHKCLPLESDGESHPPALIAALTKFLTSNPGDTNFLLELADPKDLTRGGNGFGLVTCMEDGCWSDLLLQADPELPDSGRANGLGSLHEYVVHCATEEHVKTRNQRMEQQNLVIPAARDRSHSLSPTPPQPDAYATPRKPMVTMPNDYNNRQYGFVNAAAGPSRLGMASGSSSSKPLGTSSFFNARPGSGRVFDLTANGEDDSDDEILFIGAKAGSGTNGKAKAKVKAEVKAEVKVFEVNDNGNSSDEEIKPISSSQYQASVKPPHVTAWLSMSLSERMQAVRAELEAVRQLKPTTADLKGTIKLRKGELKVVEKSFGIKQWTPPAQSILQLIPKTSIHERLRDTFTWPDPPAPAPAPVIQPAPLQVPIPAFIDVLRTWQSLDKSSRIQVSRSELMHLNHILQQARDKLSRMPMIDGLINSRIMECTRRIVNPDVAAFTLPPQVLLQYFPGLRNLLPLPLQQMLLPLQPPQLQPQAGPSNGPGTFNFVAQGGPIAPALGQFAVGGMPGAFPMGPDMDDFEGGVEFDRPQTQKDLTDFFQDALDDFKEDATVEDGLKVLKLNSINDMLPGASFTLMPHQVLGVSFMVKREERQNGSRGGLLCDAMGLGKTVQTLGIMLARDERPDDYKKAPQLIVAPVALLAQWKEEIETKTTKNWRVLIHHGAGRAKTAAGLKKHDVILTSYGTLRSEVFPNGRKKGKSKSRSATINAGSDDDSDEEVINRRSPLVSIKWYRVILDEAHNIRNKGTGTCKSVMALDVLHPWYLTGTPVVNTLKDLGPALCFIGAMDYEDFTKRVGRFEKNKPRLAAKRTQVILRPLAMRRNKESKLNGRAILNLPPKTTNLASLDFEVDERAIYAALEARAQMQVNKFIQAGTLMKNYSVVLVLLTRLRQCVNHPWLLRRKPGEEGTEGDTLVVGDELFSGDIAKCCKNDADEYGRAVGLVGGPVVESMKKKLEERYQRMTDADSTGDQDLECSICYEPFDGSELITSCQHVYCRTCLDNLFTQPLRDATNLSDEEAGRGCRICPMCRGVIEPGRMFRASAIYTPPKIQEAVEEPEPEDIKPGDIKPSTSDRKANKRAAPGAIETFFNKKAKAGDDDNKDKAYDLDEVEIEEEIPKSTKMKHLLKLVQEYIAEDKAVKIIVFSQFVGFLDLLSDFLNIHGIRNLGYRGSMNQTERSEAIRRFGLPAAIADSIPVMLISTKAGGVGLNLTVASKVICCDLAWNPATENQAVDRAHRIGQTRPVTVERLVIKDTVEDRLLEIQKQKGLLADGAMGEGSVAKLGRLTLENIRMLFAMDREYEREEEA